MPFSTAGQLVVVKLFLLVGLESGGHWSPDLQIQYCECAIAKSSALFFFSGTVKGTWMEFTQACYLQQGHL